MLRSVARAVGGTAADPATKRTKDRMFGASRV
jgi:hypothetical protein